MPPPKSDLWKYVECTDPKTRTYRCIVFAVDENKKALLDDEGRRVVCGVIFKNLATISNALSHFKHVHYLDRASPMEYDSSAKKTTRKEFIQPKLEFPKGGWIGLTKADREVMDFAACGRSFREIDHPCHRDAHNPIIRNRRELVAATIACDTKLFQQALARLKGVPVSLAIDSGTVCGRRFLCAVAHSPGKEAFIAFMGTDNFFENQRLTSVNIKSFVSGVRETFVAAGVPVVSVVADNASNMQSFKARVPGMLWVRCCAHLIALIVQDVSSADDSVKSVKRLTQSLFEKYAKQFKLPRICETRWNSLLRLIAVILKKSEAPKALTPIVQQAPEPEMPSIQHAANTVALDDDDNSNVLPLVPNAVSDDEVEELTVVTISESGSESDSESDIESCTDESESKELVEVSETEDEAGETEGVNNTTAASEKTEKLSHIPLSDAERAELQSALVLLSPLYSASTFVQATDATAFDMTVAVGTLFSCARKDDAFGNLLSASLQSDTRVSQLLQPTVLIIAYFSPNCDRFHVHADTYAMIKTNLLSATSLHQAVSPDEIPPCIEALKAELHQLDTCPLQVKDISVSLEAYLAFWKDSHFRQLYRVLSTLLRVSPTEASVEREFSVLKHVFRVNRSRASTASIAAQMRLNSLIRMNDPRCRIKRRGEKLTIDENNELFDAIKSSKLAPHIASCIMESAAPAPSSQRRQRPKVDVRDAGKCLACNQFFYNHGKEQTGPPDGDKLHYLQTKGGNSMLAGPKRGRGSTCSDQPGRGCVDLRGLLQQQAQRTKTNLIKCGRQN